MIRICCLLAFLQSLFKEFLCLKHPLFPFSPCESPAYSAKLNSNITLLKLRLSCPCCHERCGASTFITVCIIVWSLLHITACVRP